MDRGLNVNVLGTIILSQQTLLQRNWQIKIKIDIHILCEVHNIVKLINVTTAYCCHFSVLLVGTLKDVSRLYAYNKACAIAVRTLFITSPGVFFVKLNLYGLFSELIFLCLMCINNNRLMSHFCHFLLSFTSYLFIMFMFFLKWKDSMVSLLSTPPCFSPPLQHLYPLFYCFLLEKKTASKGE